MQYRNFGRLDWKVSALGFGAMRLPLLDGGDTSVGIAGPGVDLDQAAAMLHAAIDGGVNYVDTAYFYHGGQSETFLGEALKNGYRERVRLATKLPVWITTQPGDFDRILDEQLTRLQSSHIDFYLFHALSRTRWHQFVLQNQLLDRAEKALADGRIRSLGFSFHDEFAAFEQILAGSDLFDFCQIQYNYMDTENQAGRRGLQLAASRGLAVIIMEPLMGGRLAAPPQGALDLMRQAQSQRSAAAWGLHWLWDQPELSVVLSGMSTLPQVQENLAIASASGIGSFTPGDHATIAHVQQFFAQRATVPCTKCGYCMPCPAGVDIPKNFLFYNYSSLYDDPDGARFRYQTFLPEANRAAHCVQCGACLEACPQSIPIPELMPKVDAALRSEPNQK